MARKKWNKLEESQRQEREEELDRDRPYLDFCVHAANPGLDRYFGGFGPDRHKADLKSGDHRKATPKPERARFLNLLPPEQRGFTRYRNPTPGWADQRPPAWEYPFVFYAVQEITGAQPEPLPCWAEWILDRWPVGNVRPSTP